MARLPISGQQPQIDIAIEHFVNHDDRNGWHVPAHKSALLISSDYSYPVFRGLVADSTYGLDSVATCARGCSEVPPNLDCTCGFYGLTDGDNVSRPLFVSLTVAMMGRVAFFTGWRNYIGRVVVRAQYQRILSYEPLPQWPNADLDSEDGGSLAQRLEPLLPRPGSDWIPVPTPDWPIMHSVDAWQSLVASGV